MIIVKGQYFSVINLIMFNPKMVSLDVNSLSFKLKCLPSKNLASDLVFLQEIISNYCRDKKSF